MVTDDLIDALRRAVDAAPADMALRLHLAQLLLETGAADEAIAHASAVRAADPVNAPARELLARALDTPATDRPVPRVSFDWDAAESQVDDIPIPQPLLPGPAQTAIELGRPTITLVDVGGMAGVKKRLDAAFVAPRRHPELTRMYAKSLRGGLLMYGPPGCGKTYIARALAGELGAAFLTVGVADILDMYVGNSESNVHQVFEQARAAAPCVLFLDEVDAIGCSGSCGAVAPPRWSPPP